MDLLQSALPLSEATTADQQKLTEILWNWKICENCKNNADCSDRSCSWSRSGRLEKFFTFYSDVTSSYVPELHSNIPALRSHGDIRQIIQLLKEKPTTKRCDLMKEYFTRRNIPTPTLDQDRAFNVALQVMCMVNCSADDSSSIELGTQPILWHSDKTLVEFMSTAFQPEKNASGGFLASALEAKKLKDDAKLKFRGTDDLRNHLRMDAEKGVAYIYHYTSVLKEHVRASAGIADDATLPFERSIAKGNIPRQIAFDVLQSMEDVLFPFGTSSERLYRKLVQTRSFDADCLRYDEKEYRKEFEKNESYAYFSSQLRDLFEEENEPSPRNEMGKWLQRHGGARQAICGTIIGIVIAIILGILGLVLAIFQSWVAYQAWKYPVTAVTSTVTISAGQQTGKLNGL